MPETGPYLRGFGIKKNIILDEYQLNSYSITHEEVVKYRKYNYDTILNFTAIGNNYDIDNLLQELIDQTKNSRIIDSRFGNPYRCWFGDPKIIKHNKNYSQVKILCLGSSKRIFK